MMHLQSQLQDETTHEPTKRGACLDESNDPDILSVSSTNMHVLTHTQIKLCYAQFTMSTSHLPERARKAVIDISDEENDAPPRKKMKFQMYAHCTLH